MKKIVVMAVVMFYLSQFTANAQHVYSIDKVTHVQLTNYGIYALRPYDTLFAQRYILTTNPYELDESRQYSPGSTDLAGVIISMDEVQVVSKEEWLHLFFHKEYIVSQEEETIETIEMLGGDLWIRRYYEPGALENANDTATWHINNEVVFYMYMITLPNGRTYLQDVESNNYIVRLKDGYYMNGKPQTFTSQEFDAKKYGIDEEQHLYQTISRINMDFVYEPVKNKTGKWNLVDRGGNPALDATYDTVYRNQYYTIGKHDGVYDVYNLLLQPVIMNVRDFNWLDPCYIEVIQDNKVLTRGVGGEINKFITPRYFTCGTVPHFYRKLQKNNAGKFIYSSGYKYGRGASSWLMVQTVYSNLCFLNGTKNVAYTSNINIDERISVGVDWVLVKKNDQYGILQFAEKNRKLKEKQIVPAVYDSISFNRYDTYLTLYKKEQVWVCNLSGYKKGVILSPAFTTIGERGGSFLRYEMADNKKGWYNLIKGECIEDK